MAMFRSMIDYDTELEEKVLGIFLMEPLAYPTVISIAREECFYGSVTQKIFKAIKDQYEKGYGIDYLVVQRYFYDQGITELEGNKIPYIISTMQMGVVSSAHLVTWCLALRQLAAKRLMYMVKNSGDVIGDVFEESAELERRLREVMEVRITDDWVHISKVSVKLTKYMDDVAQFGIQGVSTSLNQLDTGNGGFRNTNLIVIGARPSVGKSAFMGRIAINAAKKGKTVGIISLEMDDKDILARSISSESDVPFWRIDMNQLKEEGLQRERVYNTMKNLATLPIYFSDTAQVNMTDIRAKTERLKGKHGVDLLIIDYLQLIEPENVNNRNREQEVSKICRGLKLLAMNMKIPVIILAQLNRQSEEKGDKKPQLHHLRESGSIEQDADVVMFLHRDWQSGIAQDAQGRTTEDRADLLIRKWRNGATGDVKLGFDGPKMKFWELPPEQKFEYKEGEQPQKPNAGFENRREVLPPEKEEDLPF
jgi:replicative DNA helicase